MTPRRERWRSSPCWGGMRPSARRPLCIRTAPMIVRSLDEALAPITDGCVLAVPRDVSGVAMAATRALIRRGVRRLHLVALPTSSLQADLLIGAGCVETHRDLRGQPRRIRSGAALHRGGHGGRDPGQGRDLPGAPRRVPGGGKGRAVHAAARADRLGRAGAPAGLEGGRQSVRRRRSDRAAAGDQARRRAVPRAARRPRRQYLDRPRPRARHHGACGGQDRGDGGEAARRKSVRRSAGSRPARSAASISRRSRSAPNGALAARRLPTITRPTRAHLADYARVAATADGFAAYLDQHVHAPARRLRRFARKSCLPAASPG